MPYLLVCNNLPRWTNNAYVPERRRFLQSAKFACTRAETQPRETDRGINAAGFHRRIQFAFSIQFKPPGFGSRSPIHAHLSSLTSRVLLQLVPEEVTLLMLLLRRVFNESPKLKTPLAVMENDRSL